jgi:serine/threonine protein kinase
MSTPRNAMDAPTVVKTLHVGRRSRLYLAHLRGRDGLVVIKRGHRLKDTVREFDVLRNHLADCGGVSRLECNRLLHDYEIEWSDRIIKNERDAGYDVVQSEDHDAPCNAVLRYEHAKNAGAGLLPFTASASMNDAQAARFLAPAFACVAGLHRNSRVVHCDVKPGNFVRVAEDEMVLVDFDCAAVLPEGEDSVAGHRGTPLYMAPETLRRGELRRSCDAWALGVLLYAACNDVSHPYATVEDGFPRMGMKDFVRVACDLDYDDDMWLNRDAPLARDLCRMLLDEEPEERAGLREASSHPFFAR